MYLVALINEFILIELFIQAFVDDEALIELQAGSCVNTVDTKFWLRVMVLAFVGAVQLAESAKTVVRPPVGHVGQLELEKEELPTEPVSKTVENTVKPPEHDVEGHSGQLELNAVKLPAEPF